MKSEKQYCKPSAVFSGSNFGLETFILVIKGNPIYTIICTANCDGWHILIFILIFSYYDLLRVCEGGPMEEAAGILSAPLGGVVSSSSMRLP